MDQDSNFLSTNCLVWTTDAPFFGSPRRSPSLLHLGFDWHFRFIVKLENGSYYYHLTLHRKKIAKSLHDDITVAVFYTNCVYSDVKCPNYFNLKQAKTTVLFSKIQKDFTSSLYEKWSVYCIFLTESPIGLHVNRRETFCLSNSSELKSSSEQNASTLATAKTAACAPCDDPSGSETPSTDFSELLEQNSFFDVTFRCGSRTFAAHRSVLALRSDVFAAMFRTKMEEGDAGAVIDVTDVDDGVFYLLLRYAYSGRAEDLTADTASSLYVAADRYSVGNLKTACSRWILRHLTPENCLDFLLLAESRNDENLGNRLVTFTSEILNLLEKQTWLAFREGHPNLAISVLEAKAGLVP